MDKNQYERYKQIDRILRTIEYVVVHELTHLKVENHNKLFEALMTQRLPAWRSLRARLNEFIAMPL